MKVRLNVQMSGTRDGVAWPAVGSVVELPEDEARDMLTSGTASAVNDSDQPEPVVTVPADVEKATEKFVPETARHEPAIPVEALPEEDRRPNMDVIGLSDEGEIGHGPTNPPTALQIAPEDEPVDMVAESEGQPRRTRSKTPPKSVAKSAPLTTKTGPAKTAPKE